MLHRQIHPSRPFYKKSNINAESADGGFSPLPLDVKGEALSVIKMSTKSGEKEFVCRLFTFKLQLALCKPAAAPPPTRTRSIWSLLQLKNNVHVFSCAHAFDLD